MDHRETEPIELASQLIIRPFESTDDVSAITALLHNAYKPLAEMGLRYMATHQSDIITRERLEGGESFLALIDSCLVGTITLYDSSVDCDYYKRNGVYHFGQFAVDPLFQHRGLGKKMLLFVEQHAADRGAREIALDTAMPAQHLIQYYQRYGYAPVAEVQWKDVNYKSLIMTKHL